MNLLLFLLQDLFFHFLRLFTNTQFRLSRFPRIRGWYLPQLVKVTRGVLDEPSLRNSHKFEFRLLFKPEKEISKENVKRNRKSKCKEIQNMYGGCEF